MSTQTEPKLVTQIDFARAGQITPQMKEVAEREHRDPEYIRERVADGRIAIPANIVHIKKGMRAFGVGEGLSTKVNVNLGISGDKADAAEEWKKVKIAEDFGADAIMDLSNSGKTRQFRQQLIDETPLMVPSPCTTPSATWKSRWSSLPRTTCSRSCARTPRTAWTL